MALSPIIKRGPLLALLFLALGVALGPIEPYVGRLAMDVAPPVEDKAVLWALQVQVDRLTGHDREGVYGMLMGCRMDGY